jgi:hypothetical protein
MKLQQISVFIKNSPGCLAEIATTLGGVDVNIRAMSLADTSEFGILRMVLDHNEKAVKILKNYGYAVSKTDVIGVEMEDKPGELGKLLRIMEARNLNVEYMYSFIRTMSEKIIMVMKADDLEVAISALSSEGVNIVNSSELKTL